MSIDTSLQPLDLAPSATETSTRSDRSQPGPGRYLFDETWYLSFYPDAARGVQNGRWENGFHHYREVGERQGRNPNPVFDESMVLSADPALRAAVESGEIASAADHYARIGFLEKRRVSPWIDVDWYPGAYPEVAKALDAGECPTPYDYFVRVGLSSGHISTPHFDRLAYEAAVPSTLKETWQGYSGPFEHFLRCGVSQGVTAGWKGQFQPSDCFAAALAKRELREFLASGRFLLIPTSLEPRVSVILLAEDQGRQLLACLRSLCGQAHVGLEVLLVDRSRDPATRALLDRVEGVRIVDGENRRLEAWNQAAQAARGDLLLFCSGRGRLAGETVAAAVEAFEREATAGVVGGRIVRSDGALKEAGRTLTERGVPVRWGAGANPFDRGYSYRREVPYLSTDLFVTPKSVFLANDGFDHSTFGQRLHDADYCLRLWKQGLETVVDPDIILWEGEVATDPSEVERCLAERDRTVLLARHENLVRRIASVARHSWQGAPLFPQSRGRRLLYCDDRAPTMELGSGYPRALEILWELHRLGWRLTLLPFAMEVEDFEAVRKVLPPGLEILEHSPHSRLEELLEERRGHFEVVWASRPFNMKPVRELLERREELFAGARVIYDAEALFALRESRKPGAAEEQEGQLERALAGEVALASGADLVLAASEKERQVFAAEGFPSRVVGYAPKVSWTTEVFEERSGLLVVAAVHTEDSPNYDGLRWFLAEVWPLIRRAIPEIEMDIAGHWEVGVQRPDVPDGGVRWHGQVADLSPLFSAARVFIGPTRYGAGVPLKILDAASRGLPVCTSRAMNDLLGWTAEEDLLVEDCRDPVQFARTVERAYQDCELWNRLRSGALRRIRNEHSQSGFSASIREALSIVLEGGAFDTGLALGESWSREATPISRSSAPVWLLPGATSGSNGAAKVPSAEQQLVEAHRRWRAAKVTEAETLKRAPSPAVRTAPRWSSAASSGVEEVLEAVSLEVDRGFVLPDFPHRRWTRGLLRLLAQGVLRLSRFLWVRQQRVNTRLVGAFREFSDRLRGLGRSLEDAIAAMRSEAEGLRVSTEERLFAMEVAMATCRTSLARAETRWVAHQEDHLTEVLSLRRRLREISSVRSDPGENASPGDGEVAAMNAAIQERFRGGRELIRSRMAEYLPILDEVNAGARTLPVLDVGCGRGEWLELLSENGNEGIGIDADPRAIEVCRDLGLAVVQGEALDYLSGLDEGSLGGLTALHVIEHWDFGRLLSFLSEVRRVIAPGGVLILETPNPQNLVTGCVDFLYDPTHQKPLPPALLSFLVERAGFADVGIRELERERHVRRIPDVRLEGEGSGRDLAEVVRVVNTHLLCPPDYAVVAFQAEVR